MCSGRIERCYFETEQDIFLHQLQQSLIGTYTHHGTTGTVNTCKLSLNFIWKTLHTWPSTLAIRSVQFPLKCAIPNAHSAIMLTLVSNKYMYMSFCQFACINSTSGAMMCICRLWYSITLTFVTYGAISLWLSITHCPLICMPLLGSP